MSRGMPSMTALLGLLALAGYQNRDKLAEMFQNAGAGHSKSGTGDALSGMHGNLGGLLGGAGVGGLKLEKPDLVSRGIQFFYAQEPLAPPAGNAVDRPSAAVDQSRQALGFAGTAEGI